MPPRPVHPRSTTAHEHTNLEGYDGTFANDQGWVSWWRSVRSVVAAPDRDRPRFGGAGGGFRSLQESIDTTPGARLVFHVFGSLAEFERDLIRERTMAGLAAARRRGRVGGRPTVMTEATTKQAARMVVAGTSLIEAADVFGVSRATLYPPPQDHPTHCGGGRVANLGDAGPRCTVGGGGGAVSAGVPVLRG